MTLPRSLALEARIRIPQGIRDTLRVGPADRVPLFVDRAKGARLWDVDGREYVDWHLGEGPVSLGHADAEVDAAVSARVARGAGFGLLSEEAFELAEAFSRLVPCAERTLFAKTGGEAVDLAVRLARTFTGRPLVLSCGYHGWHDPYIPEAFSPRTGMLQPPEVKDWHYDLELLERLCEAHRTGVAAILVTPEPEFFGPAFLQRCRALADAIGALLIVDEVRCGFRVAIGGAHELANVKPDLLTYAKAIGNGYPLAAVCGRAEVTEAAAARTFIFGTYHHEATSLAAGLATLRRYEREDVTGHMRRVGEALIQGLDFVFADEGIRARCLGPGAMMHLVFESPEEERTFFDASADNGALFFAFDNQSVSLSHGDDEVRATLEACARAACEVRLKHSGGRKNAARVSRAAIGRYERAHFFREGLADPDLVAGLL